MSRNLYNKTKRYPRKSRIPFSFNVFALRTGCISSLFKAFFVTRSTFVRLPCRRKAFLHQNPTILIVLYCKISAEHKKDPIFGSFFVKLFSSLEVSIYIFARIKNFLHLILLDFYNSSRYINCQIRLIFCRLLWRIKNIIVGDDAHIVPFLFPAFYFAWLVARSYRTQKNRPLVLYFCISFLSNLLYEINVI